MINLSASAHLKQLHRNAHEAVGLICDGNTECRFSHSRYSHGTSGNETTPCMVAVHRAITPCILAMSENTGSDWCTMF